MREIKFRAWDKKEKRFVIIAEIRQLIGGIFAEGQHREDKDIELMQFTGLTDKNGKEIYEGDIVKYSIQGTLQDSPLEIKIPDIFIELGHDDNYYLPQEETFEVIGNICENPELLKERI